MSVLRTFLTLILAAGLAVVVEQPAQAATVTSITVDTDSATTHPYAGTDWGLGRINVSYDDGSTDVLPPTAASWTSSDTTVATIATNDPGYYHAVAIGRATMTATYQGATASFLVTVGIYPNIANVTFKKRTLKSGEFRVKGRITAYLLDSTNNAPIAGETVSFELWTYNSGIVAYCSGVTNAAGKMSCTGSTHPAANNVVGRFAGNSTYSFAMWEYVA